MLPELDLQCTSQEGKTVINANVFLVSFFHILDHYLVTVGLAVIVAPDYTNWHTHTRLSRSPPDEGSAGLTNLYMATYKTHKRHIHAPGGFQIRSSSKRAATGIDLQRCFTLRSAHSPGCNIRINFSTGGLLSLCTEKRLGQKWCLGFMLSFWIDIKYFVASFSHHCRI